MLNETQLKMLTMVGFMVAGAIFFLNGLYYSKQADYSGSTTQIITGISFLCIGIAYSQF
jgi:uncharacterized membrane protein YhiD involved in acid resistance